MKKILLPHIRYIFKVYFTGIAVFTFFRLLLLIMTFDRTQTLPAEKAPGLLAKAFFMGFRFDSAISGYYLALPFLLLFVQSLFRSKWTFLRSFVFWFFIVTYGIGFFIAAADIPFFENFSSRLDVTIFTWSKTPMTGLKMIIEDFGMWWTVIPFVIVMVVFYKLMKRITADYFDEKEDIILKPSLKYYSWNLLSSLLLMTLMFLAIRGNFNWSHSPIRVRTAYFSTHAFPNLLGLNPVFTLLRSYLNTFDEAYQQVRLMDGKKAISNVKNYLGIVNNSDYNSPVARKITPDTVARKKRNVVLIIMESMSAAKVGHLGATDDLTPHLDSFARGGYSFSRCYAAGIHTFNGIYATLFSFPSIYRQHPFEDVTITRYDGIASVLRKQGYSSVYFTSHGEKFDNAGGFLVGNGFDKIISTKQYDPTKILSTWGVPDDYMFNFGIPILHEMAATNQPFLSVFMTTSDHAPYKLPGYYHTKNKKLSKAITEYADWSLGDFMAKAAKEPWFDNTLFVFVADHGVPRKAVYDMPLNYHHIPLVFYAPAFLKSKQFGKIASQMDVFPTIMDILRLPYINNTMGIDLLKENRPYAFFNADNKFGVIDSKHFLVVRREGESTLYDYQHGDTKNYLPQYPAKADSMKTYALSFMQAAQEMIKNGWTEIKKSKTNFSK